MICYCLKSTVYRCITSQSESGFNISKLKFDLVNCLCVLLSFPQCSLLSDKMIICLSKIHCCYFNLSWEQRKWVLLNSLRTLIRKKYRPLAVSSTGFFPSPSQFQMQPSRNANGLLTLDNWTKYKSRLIQPSHSSKHFQGLSTKTNPTEWGFYVVFSRSFPKRWLLCCTFLSAVHLHKLWGKTQRSVLLHLGEKC